MKKYIIGLMFFGTVFLVGSASVFAQTTTSSAGVRSHMQRPAVMGIVSAISGNTLTVSGKQGFGSTATTTTYTVDATNAKITKNNTTGTIASIAVGDTVMVQGTISGTNVTATIIRDGKMLSGKKFTGSKTTAKPKKTKTKTKTTVKPKKTSSASVTQNEQPNTTDQTEPIAQPAPSTTTTPTTTGTTQNVGFFGKIGQFFANIF